MATTYVNAWRKNDAVLEAQALAFWNEQHLMPQGANPAERVKQLALLAYEDEKLIGLSTINISMFEMVRQKMAFFREAVSPDHRLQSVGRGLSFETRKMIEAYALAHPEEEIGGMVAIHQAIGTGKRAISRRTRMALVGYTIDNEQVRIGWFDHFTVPANNPTS